MIYVVYYRVSTTSQDMERQRLIISRFLEEGDAVLGEHEEKQSASKKKARPALLAALTQAKHTGATLLVADLTRLTRNLHEFTGIVEAGIPFIDASNPSANRLTLNILATLAQDESDRIAARVRDGMEAKRKQGKKQGSQSPAWQESNQDNGERILAGLEKARKASGLLRTAQRTQRQEELRPLLQSLREKGHTTLVSLAEQLNARGYRTTRGCQYTPTAVRRLEE